MKRIIIIVLLPLCAIFYIGCSNKDKDQEPSCIVKTIQNSKLKHYISEFIKENPEECLYGLYFIKYSHDTCEYLIATQCPDKNTVFMDNPDDVMRINGKNVLINFGFKHLSSYDSTRAEKIIKILENSNFKFYDSGQMLFHSTGMFITVSNGNYTVTKGPLPFNAIPSMYMFKVDEPKNIIDSINKAFRRQVDSSVQN